MKKSYFAAVLTLTCLLGMGMTARAQDASRVLVKVPFEFVVGGRALPGGTYWVSRVDSTAGSQELEIRSYETHAGVLLNPTAFDGLKTGHAQLNFEQAGDKYFLSAIKTPIGTYTVTIPLSAVKIAQMEQQSASPSGSN